MSNCRRISLFVGAFFVALLCLFPPFMLLAAADGLLSGEPVVAIVLLVAAFALGAIAVALAVFFRGAFRFSASMPWFELMWEDVVKGTIKPWREEQVAEFVECSRAVSEESKRTESYTSFQAALKQEGALVLYWLGKALTKLDRHEEALRCFRSVQWLISVPWMTLARTEDQRIDWFRTARKLRQSNNYWRGKALFLLGRFEEALLYLERACKSSKLDEDRPRGWLAECLRIYQLCAVGAQVRTQSKTSWWIRSLRGNENKAWNSVCKKARAAAYDRFLRKFPDGIHAEAAKASWVELDWVETCQKDRTWEYALFLLRHPGNFHGPDAEGRIDEIESECELVQKALHEVIGSEFQWPVQFNEKAFGYWFHVSLGLLRAFASDDFEPSIPGVYDLASLEHYAKWRTVQVYRAAFTSRRTIQIRQVTVDCNHGTHYREVSGYSSHAEDRVMPWFSTDITDTAAAKHDWSIITDETIASIWRVRQSLFSRLTIAPK